MNKEQLLAYINDSTINLMFVLTAIDNLASAVIDREAEVLAQKHMIVNPSAWIQAAKDAQQPNR